MAMLPLPCGACQKGRCAGKLLTCQWSRLSSSFVRKANCPADQKKIDYFDTTMRGFMLEVRASGGKTYYQRYTDERGRERQYKIGPADVLTLRQAKTEGDTDQGSGNPWR